MAWRDSLSVPRSSRAAAAANGTRWPRSLGVAELDQQFGLHAVAARGLGQQGQFDLAVGQVERAPQGALVDIGWRRIEGLDGLEVQVALVVLEDGRQVGALRQRRALQLSVGM